MSHIDQAIQKLYGTSASVETQRRAFTSGEVPVAVYGLGKMGLPLAGVYAVASENVIGVDIDESVVEAIKNGHCPVENEPGLPRLVRRTVERGKLDATTDIEAAADAASVHVLLVPTLLNDRNEPDLSTLVSLTRDIVMHVDAGDMIIVESTVPPGTCEDVIQPMLKRGSPDAGNVGLAFCPERTMSGRALRDIRESYPKIVGGVDPESTRVAKLIYEEITTNEVYTVRDARTAECVKIFEGLYRDVNIALANELATVAPELGVDVNEVIEIANTQPFCDLHQPGIGVGGHCIPVYPYFFLDSIETTAPMVRMARQINDSMPQYAIQTVESRLQDEGRTIDGSTIAVLGVTYRPGVDEVRNSPARPIIRELYQRGAAVYVVDPVCSTLSTFDGKPTSIDAVHELDLDAAIVVTAHEEFDRIDWSRFDPMVIVDGRQTRPAAESDHQVETIGDGQGSH